MKIESIRNDEELRAALQRLELLFQGDETEEMEALVALIEEYENKHYPIQESPPLKPSNS